MVYGILYGMVWYGVDHIDGLLTCDSSSDAFFVILYFRIYQIECG